MITSMVERAAMIMKRDAELVSGGSNLFWNHPQSGLEPHQVQNFNHFYRLDTIQPGLVTDDGIFPGELFDTYDDFVDRLRYDQHDQKILMEVQSVFVVIITSAIDRYRLR